MLAEIYLLKLEAAARAAKEAATTASTTVCGGHLTGCQGVLTPRSGVRQDSPRTPHGPSTSARPYHCAGHEGTTLRHPAHPDTAAYEQASFHRASGANAVYWAVLCRFQ
jgi:hypothetical protein